MKLLISKYILLFVVLFSSILESSTTTRTQIIMGTYITISVQEQDKKFIQDAFDIFNDIDRSISSYNQASPIYKLNKEKTAFINNYAYEALLLSENYYEKTDGYFDITIGSITKDLYRFGEKQRIPHAKELENASVNFKGLVFTEHKASLEEKIKVDLGGMGKGFAVDKVSDFFKTKNVQNAVIAASGDIRCFNTCPIDIQNPYEEGVLLSFRTIKKDTGVTTSGNYNRYVESTKNNHLINPKSKLSQEKFISITLISNLPSSDLDAYATAASVMPIKKAYEFLNELNLAYVILQSDGELRMSDNLSSFVELI